MVIRRILVLLIAFGILASACSDTISANDCDELADETMELFQGLIDDIDSEFEDMSVGDFLASGGELPSVTQFEEDAATIDELATELGCTQSEIGVAVQERVNELTAESDLGRFLIDAIRAGGL